MNRILIIIAFCGSSLLSVAQVSITGKLKDQNQALPFATVRLLAPDSSLVQGCITDSAGVFSFKKAMPGKYLVSASTIGYASYTTDLISVGNENINLEAITLHESSTQLGEIEVKAQRNIVDHQLDRVSINIQNSVTSSGNTMLEVLQKLTGVMVNKQSNTISINGRTGVRLMVNGKLLQVPMEAAIQMLEGMSAGNVEKVELISAPPAKYDAEGSGGIIHLITKENVDLGTNGSLGVSLGARQKEAVSGNFTVHHRGQDFAFYVDYALVRNHNLSPMQMTRKSHDGDILQTDKLYSHRDNVTTQQNLSLGGEWTPSKNILVSLLFTGYNRNWNLDAQTTNENFVSPNSTSITQMEIRESNIWKSGTASLGVQLTVNEKSSLHFNVDHLYYHNDNPSTYLNKVNDPNLPVDESRISLEKDTPIRFFTSGVDYKYEVSPTFTLELGLKAVTSTLKNDVVVQRSANGETITDPLFTSYSTLDETVAGSYASFQWKPSSFWQINAGLRYEHTHTNIQTIGAEESINRKYGNFFPGISLLKNLDKEKDLQFSYARRIMRPTFNDIAPFVFFWGPNTFSAGNTSLYPAISDAFTAGFHLRQWNVSLQYTHSRNEIVTIQPETDDEQNLIYRSQNLKYANTLVLSNSYTAYLASWWELQSSITVQRQLIRPQHLIDNEELELYSCNLNLINVFRLPKSFSIEVSGMYQSHQLSGISEFLPLGSLNVGIQKKIDERGSIRLAMDDILNSSNWRVKTYLPANNLDTYFHYHWNNRFIRLSYKYNFGNDKLRSVKVKSGAQEEQRRVQ